MFPDKIFDSLTTKSHRDLSVHVPPGSTCLGLACNKVFLSGKWDGGGGENWEGGSGAASRLRLSCFLVLVLLIDRGCFYSLSLIYSGLGDFQAYCFAHRKSKLPVGAYLGSKCQ